MNPVTDPSAALAERLPEHLRERLHPVGGGPPRPDGHFVVYWMRTAVRGHENPALDTALVAAGELGVPAFVYHALSERYPYASDRHHRFILEGAREVAAELAERGVAHAFHLERPGHRGRHLATLARRAALVVTEDMPVQPLEGWTTALAQGAGCPVWAVDTACTLPMRSVPAKKALRAYRFRKATEGARMARVRAGWRDAEAPTPPFLPDLPFEPVELAAADLDDLVARCAIDHAVAPVPHTRGGSGPGYARWSAFRDDGLKRYHRTRNDPLRDGVSRMSPYLHYGMVSPLRIAREAHRSGASGADKYLDELLTWRELAHAFCAHHPERDTVAALPEWARATLAEHASDPRPALLTWETLARARTGDGLWDAAQRSLLTHGELHNNVRMTWGKALLKWTPSAERALALLIDLNHRYALDGRDPSSYGGILWCLGQFDRPFSPEKPIVGTVRPRDTEYHARRLDTDEYAARTQRPARAAPPRVAVVGAGMAGLACARTLADHGVPVTVLDKGRRPGGRVATRTSRQEPTRVFDHGAQYFTARDDRFRRLVASWADAGVVVPWDGPVVEVDAAGVRSLRRADTPRWVGAPGMHAVGEHVAADLDVHSGVRVTGLERRDDGWHLPAERVTDADDPTLAERGLGPFEAVVVTAPAPQAATLLGDHAPALRRQAEAARMLPCWALMVAFAAPIETDFAGARFAEGPLAWMARDPQRPGRPAPQGQGDRWVVHARADWSEAHLKDDPDAVSDALLEALEGELERWGLALPGILHRAAHRWRYARPAEGPGDVERESRIVAGDDGLVLAGDWVVGARGARVEAAWLSGVAAAAHVLARGPDGPERFGGPPSAAAPEVDLQEELFA
jgi:hypothetical protein